MGKDSDGDADEETLEEDSNDSGSSDSVTVGGTGGRLFGAGEDDANVFQQLVSDSKHLRVLEGSCAREMAIRLGHSDITSKPQSEDGSHRSQYRSKRE